VAPCSHTWHYKCIRSLLQGPSFPIFICPNCRAAADLEAEVEEASEEWQQLESEDETADATTGGPSDRQTVVAPVPRLVETRASMEQRPSGRRSTDRRSTDRRETEAVDATMHLDTMHLDTSGAPHRPILPHNTSSPIPIAGGAASTGSARNTRTPSPTAHPLMNGTEGPITPRNDAGPWVFDGSAGRRASEASAAAVGATRSLNAAVDMEVDSGR
jgi:E3 ubiquitin-protein ligase DMA1/2